VRDDAIVLYGFPSYLDREFFELLLVTPGVGPRPPSRPFARCQPVTSPRRSSVTTPRRSRRFRASTQDRESHRAGTEGKVVVPDSYVAAKPTPQNDAIEDALRGLGYSTQEVRQALSGTTLSDDEGAALRQALQLLRRQ